MVGIIFKVIEHGIPDYFSAVKLREEVLQKALGLIFLEKELDKEKDHIQIVGAKENEIVATLVLAPEGEACKMRRVVVKTDLQNSGIGTQMMVFCEAQAKVRGFRSIYCHAHDAAVNFYLRNNYRPEGDYFIENTIPHLQMRKNL